MNYNKVKTLYSGGKWSKTILAVIIYLVFSSVTAFSESRPDLIIGVLPDVDSIPLLVAEKEGFFEKGGVSVRIERFTSPVNRDTSFQSGSIDGAVSDILAALLALNGGFDVRITSLTNGSYKLVASGNSGIKKISDIKGKSVAMSLNTVIEYCTDRMAASAGLAAGSYGKTVISQIPVRLEMLKAGKVAAATLPEPLATAAASGGSGAVIIDSSENHGINPGVMLFSSVSLSQKTKEINAFYTAYNKAVLYLNNTPSDEIDDFLIKECGFPESVRGVITLPAYTNAALPAEEEFNNVRKWLEDRKLIKKGISYRSLTVRIY
ncbi:MAG: MetQ/NlpA family ABC transporter substrate-binding protein [Spirochaetia bacterium]|jgi:NitT/TauT family transport system substrate-binding protein|nr:MetQ/NlpA family ABC transporter substrate-binding protein [Spirochaetia bacterium]